MVCVGVGFNHRFATEVPRWRRRYPEEIEERAAASAQKLSELKKEKVAKERAERKSRFDQYFQPFAYGL